MKAPFSTYLTGIAPGLKELIAKLEDSYDYVSILSTDSKGFAVRVSRHAKTVQGKTMTTERGNVVRVAKNGLYSEYAFNEFEPSGAERMAAKIRKELDAQLQVLTMAGTDIVRTPCLPDEPCELFV